MHSRRSVVGAFCLLWLGALWAVSAGEVPSETAASELRAERTLLRGAAGEVIGVRLSNGGHAAALFAGLPYATVDGRLVELPQAPQATAGDLLIGRAALDVLRGTFGQGAAAASGASSFTVVIDPGHGGNDPGCIGLRGTTEKEVNLAVSLALAGALRREGVRVVLTRATDENVDLERRAQVANEAGCDLFVSVHANAVAGDRNMNGHMVIVPADDWERRDLGNVADRALEAARIKGLISRSVPSEGLSAAARATLLGVVLEEYRRRSFFASEEIVAAMSREIGSRNRGTVVDVRGLRVLRKTYCPAVLVEVDFLSNPTIEQRLTDRAYQKRVAGAIARGVMAFLKKHHGAGE